MALVVQLLVVASAASATSPDLTRLQSLMDEVIPPFLTPWLVEQVAYYCLVRWYGSERIQPRLVTNARTITTTTATMTLRSRLCGHLTTEYLAHRCNCLRVHRKHSSGT